MVWIGFGRLSGGVEAPHEVLQCSAAQAKGIEQLCLPLFSPTAFEPQRHVSHFSLFGRGFPVEMQVGPLYSQYGLSRRNVSEDISMSERPDRVVAPRGREDGAQVILELARLSALDRPDRSCERAAPSRWRAVRRLPRRAPAPARPRTRAGP